MEQYTKTLVMDYNNKILTEAYLTKMTKSEAILYLESPETIDDPVLFVGKSVKLKVMDNSTGLAIYTGVISYRLVETFHVKGLKLVDRIQQRKDLKLLVFFSSDLFILTEKHIGEMAIKSKIPVENGVITIKDMSAGGICFESQLMLDKEIIYNILFTEGREPLELDFKILRITEGKNNIFTYGCIFTNSTNQTESIIREYIFKMQNAANKALRKNN